MLLLGLWVRSGYWFDALFLVGPTDGTSASVMSRNGCLGGSYSPVDKTDSHWECHSWRLSGIPPQHGLENRLGFGFWRGPDDFKRYVFVPYWFLTSLTFGVALAPGIRWTYSVRTLLIATTLIAVVLGLVMWACG